MAFCTRCGTPSTAEQRYCVVCGSPLAPSPPPPGSPSPTSATPPWTPAPPLSDEESLSASSLVLLGVPATPPQQSRLTVLLRGILCLPLLFWLALLSGASGLCVVVAWFSALFTRRVPRGLQEFVTEVLRYSAEVQAYASALVGRWPGFSIHPGPQNQVSLEIHAFELNRAAVFFRYFLSLPATAVLFLVNLGAYVLTVLAWTTALVLGRTARPLYQARLLALRFSLRYSAYVYLLTPTQPFSGFFGDRGALDARTTPSVGPSSEPAPLTTRLQPSTGGRTFFILSLVVGVILGGLYVSALPSLFGRTLGRAVLTGVNQQVQTTVDGFILDFPHCVAAQDLVCARTDGASAVGALSTQIATLTTVEGLIPGDRATYMLYLGDLQRLRDDVEILTIDTSLAQQNALYRNDVLPDYSRLEQQYHSAYASV